MTKFINNSGTIKELKKKTKFIKVLLEGKFTSTCNKPSNYDIVEYLGRDGSKDLFRAKDDDWDYWHFYIGELGDEFV